MHDEAETQTALTWHNSKPTSAQMVECHGRTVEKVLKHRTLHFVQLEKRPLSHLIIDMSHVTNTMGHRTVPRPTHRSKN